MANESEIETTEQYLEYVESVVEAVNGRFMNADAATKASIVTATLTPKFFWMQAQEAEKMGDEIGKLADELIGQLKAKRASRPVYNLLSRAVYRVSPGKNLAAMDYAAPDFKPTIVKALKHVDYSGLVYTNILKLME